MNAARSSKLSLKSIYSRFVAGRASGRGEGPALQRERRDQRRERGEPSPPRSWRSPECWRSGAGRGRGRGGGDRPSDYLFARGEIKFALLRPRVRPRGIRPLIASFLFLASPLLTPGAALFPVTRASLYPIPFYSPSRSLPAERRTMLASTGTALFLQTMFYDLRTVITRFPPSFSLRVSLSLSGDCARQSLAEPTARYTRDTRVLVQRCVYSIYLHALGTFHLRRDEMTTRPPAPPAA